MEFSSEDSHAQTDHSETTSNEMELEGKTDYILPVQPETFESRNNILAHDL